MAERTSRVAAAMTSSTGRGEARAVLLEPAQHVLHPHHRVVHQLADGDGQPAQGHGVDGQAEVAEHQRRDQQGHRDRHEGDERGAGVEQEQEQDHRHQDGAVAQGLLHVGHRVLDEGRLLEQEAGLLDPRRQGAGQFGDGLSTSRVRATLSAPGCFCTDRITAGLPL
jgi:hypothetical protein